MAIIRPESNNVLQARLKSRADRRTVIKAGTGVAVGAAAIATGVGLAGAQSDSTPAAATASADICVLTPELTEGPYYLAGDLVRANITDGREGVPLNLTINVVNPTSCSVIENAAVDIWHCDALGYYSGVSSNQPGAGDPKPDDIDEIPDESFLRGIQLTDADGNVTFETIYPGWYSGRAIHIHMKVYAGGDVEASDETYDGGHTSHTGQLFFDEAISDDVFSNPPYSTRVTTRLANTDDNILGDHGDEPGFMLTMELVDESDIAKGINATITVGVDTDTTRSGDAATGGGGGGQGGDTPPGGGQGGNPPDDGQGGPHAGATVTPTT